MKTPRANATPPSGPRADGVATVSAGPAEGEERPCGPEDATLDGPAEGAAADPSIPARVGRYLVIGRLGHGGMGVVLEAFDPELDRRVALKLLHPERSGGSSRLRLLREAQALARLSHPNVVQVYDVGMHRDQVFMAMELVRGRTISAWLRERARSWTEVVEHFVAAGQGLRAAHEVGLVHRDFKPQNVLVGDDGRVRVADFGLAGAGDAQRDTTGFASSEPEGPITTSYLATPLTATGAVLGTPRYMAPEQHGGLEVGPAADQFGFCVALHEALFGSYPFGGDSLAALAVNVLEGRIVAPPAASKRPKWLLAAIHRGLATNPVDRYPSMERLLYVLEHEPLRRRRRRWAGAMVLALGLGGAGATWLGLRIDAPCRGGEAALAEVWSEPQRRAVVAAMTSEGETADVVVRALDDYADRWVESHRGVCLEHRDEAMSSGTFDAAMGCLQRGRAALDGVVQTVGGGEPEAVRAGAGAAARLPAPALCRDRGRLALDFAPPDDPAQVAAVEGLRERLARAEAVHDAGALRPALDELGAIARQSAALHYAPLEAERALIAARLAMDRNDWPLAQRELARALVEALTSKADLIAAEAMARTLFVDSMLVDPDDRDPTDVAVAEALVERIGAPGGLAALLANNVGVMQVMSGNMEAAARSFEQALEHADASDDVDPVDHCGYISNVARNTADPMRRDALFARAQALALRWLGPEHEKTLELAMLRGQYAVDPKQALEHMVPACHEAAARRAVDWSRCLCHFRVAELYEQLEAPLEARAALGESEACLESEGSSASLDLPALQREKTAGYAALLRGDHQHALARLDVAQRGLQTRAELPWIALELADVALLRARSLHALGRGAEAIDPLRSAIATYDLEITRSEDRASHQRRERARKLLVELEAQRRSSISNDSTQR